MFGFLPFMGRFLAVSVFGTWILAEIFLFLPRAEPFWNAVQATLRLPTHNEWSATWMKKEREELSQVFASSRSVFVRSLESLPGVRFEERDSTRLARVGFQPINRHQEFASSDYLWFSP